MTKKKNRVEIKDNEAVGDGFVVLDAATGCLVEVNDAYCRMTGYARDELLGMHASRLDGSDNRKAVFERIQRVVKNEFEIFETTHICRDRSLIPLELSVTYSHVQGGQVLCFVRDLREKKRQEQALLEAQKNYEMLFREMLNGFAVHEIICDAQGTPVDYRFLVVNPAFERLTGLKAEDILGRTVLDVFPQTEQTWIETCGRVAINGDSIVCENELGSLGKRFEVTAFRPNPGQFACIFVDITKRRKAEEALRESEERYRFLSDLTMEGVFIHRNGVISDMNAAMARMVGFKREELIGRMFFDFVHPDDRDLVLRKLLEQGSTRYVVRVMKRDGTTFTAEVEAYHANRGGENCRVTAVHDITERLALEEQLRHAQKMESVGRLAGGVAHDFNNKLQVILGYSEMALETLDPSDPLFPDLKEIYHAAQHSGNITRQLLAFARRQDIVPGLVDLNEVVEGMLNMLRRLLGEDVELIWNPAAGPCTVRMDMTQIDQVLVNLCINARDAITGAGRVQLETRQVSIDPAGCKKLVGAFPGEYVLLSVTDDGCGMDGETLGKVFEPFFTTKKVGKGLGLGLASTYGIVKQNEGFIQVESEPGHGAAFRIYLPHFADQVIEASSVEADSLPRGHGETILIVEDEEGILNLSGAILKRLGYQVLSASLPDEALRLAETYSGQIDLLMSDVLMPGMTGKELADRLSVLYPRLKQLYMSGYADHVIERDAHVEQEVLLIYKPFSRMGLAETVCKALKKKGAVQR
ncbi:MAG: PAS domain S-box protein [Kiritimatiellae bacterium]|nr:PAS domain S-box protein [Kiritimatiellia bacterium]